mmetsp:Transcript_39230/g.83761  ORF Transcript_39230/g.83761 Transcript_39230/m.83761 type:complete len:326 (-) Transcript_39230:427-1404(-)|eukprot:CAMPEP_0172525994 /NCGR_PEP_ID=MMETSP1067-20121228/1008_1 /TAXON_ID=265564 ORGANISM="Thalassiosira punctigera, Strain Tpunct2005C2" /NCGR_SAMPLE_ID=MMETSP1067 /ASSEMBLY_ACC=CAM_ASM_000444 /LENGTH=325 /DNA_ID=CAMNT_0013309403 /DNA_START=31 /DNA_END=1008 /DNA_ORIENTATION=+
MVEDGDEEDGVTIATMEMTAVATISSDDEHSVESGSFPTSDVDSDYGEQTLTPKTVTKNTVAKSNDFYRAAVQRQNRYFGASMVAIAGSFLAAYILMGLTFTPSNIGIFGDESSMKGGLGEVGLDADNAETQKIVDEEIVAQEEAGQWGDMGHSKAAKKRKKRITDFTNRFENSNVGKNKWVENKDWWKKNSQNLDPSHMTKEQMKRYKELNSKLKRRKKKKKLHCYNHPNDPVCEHGAPDPNLDSIREELANHYSFETRAHGPPPEWVKNQGPPPEWVQKHGPPPDWVQKHGPPPPEWVKKHGPPSEHKKKTHKHEHKKNDGSR